MIEKFKSRILLLLLMIMSVFFFVGGPSYYSSRSFHASWDLGHILFFFLLTIYILKNIRTVTDWTYIKTLFFLLAFSLCLGSAIELLQWGIDRSPDYLDLLRDLIGCLLALAFISPARKSAPVIYIRSLQFLVVLMVGICVFPVMEALYDEYMAHREFPILSDFERSDQLRRWTSGHAALFISKEIKKTGKASLQVNLTEARYSGVILKYFPHDWRAQKCFKLSVFNASSQPLRITISIHDDTHYKRGGKTDDRFNKIFILQVGWNDIEIPIKDILGAPRTRRMNPSRIMNVLLFVPRLSKGKTIYIDDVKLDNKCVY